MVGSSELMQSPLSDLENGTMTEAVAMVKISNEIFNPAAVVPEPLPPLVLTNGQDQVEYDDEIDQHKKREIVLGRNVHTTCLAVTEPEANDEVTGDKDAFMASVLARYRKTLVERTKYHLGNQTKTMPYEIKKRHCVSFWSLKNVVCVFVLTGYPYNLDFDYGAVAQLQHFSINNLGDPFIESNYGVHSRQFEVGVLDWFARLWEIEKDEYWGYITNCGTEGNLHGILVGSVFFF